jgi:exopolysaccharide biosynthesis polyprenyl glycosylphosphotransferase
MASDTSQSDATDRLLTTSPEALTTPAEAGWGRSIGGLFSPSTGHSLTASRRVVRPWLHALLLILAVIGAILTTDGEMPSAHARAALWLMVPLVLVLLASRGYYRRCIQLDVVTDLLRTIAATSLAAIAILAAEELIDPASNSGALVIRAWALATLMIWISVPLLTVAERHLRRAGAASVPTLLVGCGPVAQQIERRLRDEPELGLNVVGYVAGEADREEIPEGEGAATVLGRPDELTEVIRLTGARHVIFTFIRSADGREASLAPLIRSCEQIGVQVSLVPRMFERVDHSRVALENIGRVPVLSLGNVQPKGWQFGLKHALDRLMSAGVLLLLSPLMLGIALAVRLSSPGPILFRQSRVGRDGRRFEMLKFRSMRPAEAKPRGEWMRAGSAPGGVEGEDRRTAVGRFIRAHSLDELPQLLNVLKGEMSMIGPRPERPEFVEVFDEEVNEYSDRHRVKSGITGLAQVNGLRGQTSITDRASLDNYYIQHWSMVLDLKILLGTFAAVLRSAE